MRINKGDRISVPEGGGTFEVPAGATVLECEFAGHLPAMTNWMALPGVKYEWNIAPTPTIPGFLIFNLRTDEGLIPNNPPAQLTLAGIGYRLDRDSTRVALDPNKYEYEITHPLYESKRGFSTTKSGRTNIEEIYLVKKRGTLRIHLPKSIENRIHHRRSKNTYRN